MRMAAVQLPLVTIDMTSTSTEETYIKDLWLQNLSQNNDKNMYVDANLVFINKMQALCS